MQPPYLNWYPFIRVTRTRTRICGEGGVGGGGGGGYRKDEFMNWLLHFVQDLTSLSSDMFYWKTVFSTCYHKNSFMNFKQWPVTFSSSLRIWLSEYFPRTNTVYSPSLKVSFFLKSKQYIYTCKERSLFLGGSFKRKVQYSFTFLFWSFYPRISMPHICCWLTSYFHKAPKSELPRKL